MSNQRALFSANQTRFYFDALDRHEKLYNAPRLSARKSADALREKLRLKDERDARRQAFFEAMMRPPCREKK